MTVVTKSIQWNQEARGSRTSWPHQWIVGSGSEMIREGKSRALFFFFLLARDFFFFGYQTNTTKAQQFNTKLEHNRLFFLFSSLASISRPTAT